MLMMTVKMLIVMFLVMNTKVEMTIRVGKSDIMIAIIMMTITLNIMTIMILTMMMFFLQPVHPGPGFPSLFGRRRDQPPPSGGKGERLLLGWEILAAVHEVMMIILIGGELFALRTKKVHVYAVLVCLR